MMGQARKAVSGFMQDFMQGFAQSTQQHGGYDSGYNDMHRISDKVAATTADDYYDYQSKNSVNQPFRRVGDHAANLPENAPLVEKPAPEVANIVEMLKHLQPKQNVTDFVIRLARHIKSQPRKPNKAQQFRFVSEDGDEIKYYAKQHHGDAANVTKSSAISKTSEIVEGGKAESARVFSHHPPHGLPSYENLPAATKTYFKNGVYHHVHDLRKNAIPPKRSTPGWMAFNFEETILQALGLTHPGRSAKPTVVKCSKSYAFHVIARIFYSFLG
jgi:hypothetical protein